MTLITPEFLQRPFADSGDTSPVPQTDPTGFVNYQDGYTSFYEISLTANNPQAKAVERPIQNYLFKTMTQNAMAWQRMSIAPWYSSTDGNTVGYAESALVMRESSGTAQIYRSLKADNMDDPLSSPLSWELQPTVASTISRIPMQHGGTGGPSGAVLTTGNFNAFARGVYEVSVGANSSYSNAPIYPGTTQVENGMLEVLSWTFTNASGGTVNAVMQRFTGASGSYATRYWDGSGWSNWNFFITLINAQAAAQNQVDITSTDGLSYTGTLTPAGINPVPNGFQLRLRNAGVASVDGNVTLTIQGFGGGAAFLLYGTAGNRLAPGEWQAGSEILVEWRNGTGWLCMAIAAGKPTASRATAPSHITPASQIQDGSMTYTVDTFSLTTPNAFGGVYAPPINSPAPSTILRFTPSTTNTGPCTFTPSSVFAARPITDTSYNQLAAGMIESGSVCTVAWSQSQACWVLVDSTGQSANTSAVPVGAILQVAQGAAPAGYLECDGSLQSQAALPQLYAQIGLWYAQAGDPAGMFRLPDTRGFFVRGWDNGAGRDPGRIRGSRQVDSVVTHTHTGTTSSDGLHTHSVLKAAAGNNTAGPYVSPANAGSGGSAQVSSDGAHTHTFTTDATGGTETRPINVAFMFVIKCFDTVVNQATVDVGQLLAQVSALQTKVSAQDAVIAALGRVTPGQQIYATPGSYTFTVPAGVTANTVMEVEVWGGGGGGSAWVNNTVSGGGGGSGGYAYKLFSGANSFVAGQQISIVVGSGGTAGPNSTAGGGDGTESNFGVGTLIASGGGGSKYVAVLQGLWTAGVGGAATGGDLNFPGNPGTYPQGLGTSGGAAWQGGNGGAAPRGGSGGVGGMSSATTVTAAGATGNAPGGGGGGGCQAAATSTGGAGAPGMIRIAWR